MFMFESVPLPLAAEFVAAAGGVVIDVPVAILNECNVERHEL